MNGLQLTEEYFYTKNNRYFFDKSFHKFDNKIVRLNKTNKLVTSGKYLNEIYSINSYLQLLFI